MMSFSARWPAACINDHVAKLNRMGGAAAAAGLGLAMPGCRRASRDPRFSWYSVVVHVASSTGAVRALTCAVSSVWTCGKRAAASSSRHRA
jgi:hypothetical protein